jgi:lysophospholipase L1-like esterase
MKRTGILYASLLLNVVFLIAGAWLASRALSPALLAPLEEDVVASTLAPDGEPFVETADFRWPAQLFAKEPVRPGAIVFLGDSLTAGGAWQAVWSGELATPVLNRGIPADTIDGVAERLPEVLRHRPTKIFLMIGLNDLRLGGTIDSIARRHRALVERILAESPDTVVFVESVLPVRNALNRSIVLLNRALESAADGRRVRYVDLHSAFVGPDGRIPPAWTSDGFHLRAVAYERWREQVRPLLSP